jgi:O-antigen/teichoic acid export membrane protein
VGSSASDSARVQGRFTLGDRSLREHATRGTLVNTAFMIGLGLVSLLKGFVLAIFLTREDYGVWGILAASLGTLFWLKQIGISDKYIQQDEADQELAFQRAFTLELWSTLLMMGVLAVALPLICVIYGEWVLFLPGLVIILLIMPAGVLRAPVWVFYRRMEFFKQRALQAVDPIVGLFVAVGFAVAGFGYWAMLLGMVAGAWAAAIAAVVFTPYKLRLRADRASLRDYWAFSWPLFASSAATMALAQIAVISTEAALGLAGVGALALAYNISQFANHVDHLITGTLYPAICAVRDRLDLLQESFVKSNRLALMWALPFGFALTLFCGDLVTYVIGDEEWRPAVVVLQVYGATAALGHLGFNWTAYFRAYGETRPMAVASFAELVAFVAVGLPLLFAYGLPGFAAGVGAQTLTHLAFRAYYLRRLFHNFGFLVHAARSMLPTVPGIALVLALRALEPVERTELVALAELALYGAVIAGVTWWLERGLVREVIGYLRPRAPVAAA